MSLSDEYRRQYGWRPWSRVLEALPPLRGQVVLDLGCGVGDQAVALVARGAWVIGFDGNEALVEVARSRRLPGAVFHAADLRALPELETAVDGIWCSFGAAYFPDLVPLLASWGRFLAPTGWIALTELDGLFGHGPVGAATRAALDSYVQASLAAGRHDFHMGRKLADHLRSAGFTVSDSFQLQDRELAFDGPAPPEVVEAWRQRFDRLTLLQRHCGADFTRVRDDFLASLVREDHACSARVHCCIATRACANSASLVPSTWRALGGGSGSGGCAVATNTGSFPQGQGAPKLRTVS